MMKKHVVVIKQDLLRMIYDGWFFDHAIVINTIAMTKIPKFTMITCHHRSSDLFF